ncbi:MAG: hypothetical protein DLM59_17340 [Pseudonocardiales bacterium]|nr:MAG: hypothetical protein DLM59_17340 [Pseudonocardiales bacterium]
MSEDQDAASNDTPAGENAESRHIDPAEDPTPRAPNHLAPDDAGPRPWVDASKDPTPGVPGHAAPDDED